MAERTNKNVIVLSLHPIHANAILDGIKTVEFRRSRIPSDAQAILVYATAPISKVIGTANVAGYQEAAPTTIWRKFRKYGNVPKAFFDSYFLGAKQARCYLLKSPKRFKKPLVLADFGISTAPQSFAYVRDISPLA
jgi:predicted transcriptional regulator